MHHILVIKEWEHLDASIQGFTLRKLPQLHRFTKSFSLVHAGDSKNSSVYLRDITHTIQTNMAQRKTNILFPKCKYNHAISFLGIHQWLPTGLRKRCRLLHTSLEGPPVPRSMNLTSLINSQLPFVNGTPSTLWFWHFVKFIILSVDFESLQILFLHPRTLFSLHLFFWNYSY